MTVVKWLALVHFRSMPLSLSPILVFTSSSRKLYGIYRHCCDMLPVINFRQYSGCTKADQLFSSELVVLQSLCGGVPRGSVVRDPCSSASTNDGPNRSLNGTKFNIISNQTKCSFVFRLTRFVATPQQLGWSPALPIFKPGWHSTSLHKTTTRLNWFLSAIFNACLRCLSFENN